MDTESADRLYGKVVKLGNAAYAIERDQSHNMARALGGIAVAVVASYLMSMISPADQDGLIGFVARYVPAVGLIAGVVILAALWITPRILDLTAMGIRAQMTDQEFEDAERRHTKGSR